jgi:hypothetical protein
MNNSGGGQTETDELDTEVRINERITMTLAAFIAMYVAKDDQEIAKAFLLRYSQDRERKVWGDGYLAGTKATGDKS